ncbi:hypothetical protein Scep_029895 [Stephania cephalantha]|uniref:WAT1-related protein n=1 Tax=Stephania cephalantha TaxID=152367 RepID=A0AAP0E693_9MAGN
MVFTQIGYTFLYFITEASFNNGMNPHVHLTYRHIVSGLVMLPFAYVLERKERPKLTLALFAEIFVLSLLGMEVLNIKSQRGIAKVLGTIISLAGVMIMTLFKGPKLRSLWGAVICIKRNSTIHENWLKGSILAVASCIAWSMFFVLQASSLKRYPAQLSLTTWMSFIGGAQTAVFAAFVKHKPSEWIIGLNIDFWCVLYAGIVCSGLIVFIQLWCTEQKGPVFVTMFNPLGTVMVALLAYFVFGEKLYTGSIVGGAIVIAGLYLVLWGKEGDPNLDINSEQESRLSYAEQLETKIQVVSSLDKNS